MRFSDIADVTMALLRELEKHRSMSLGSALLFLSGQRCTFDDAMDLVLPVLRCGYIVEIFEDEHRNKRIELTGYGRRALMATEVRLAKATLSSCNNV